MPRKYYLYAAWIIAFIATISSLVLSEVFHLIPCTLCWYQRILMYPLVIILAVGIDHHTPKLHHFVLPFAVPGALLALYHWLLQLELVPHAETLCQAGISCTTRYISFAGIVTIPALSLITFTLIAISLILYAKGDRKA